MEVSVVTRDYIKKLRSFAAKFVKRGETIFSAILIVLGAYAAIMHYLVTNILLNSILYLMGFWPAAISFYIIMKFPPTSKRRISKITLFWPAVISLISYFVPFFTICWAKYTFYPPEDNYDELFFLGRLIPASLALSFFLTGLVAKLGKIRSELYFMLSGLFGVFTGMVDTLGIVSFGPPPQPWGLFSSLFAGLILGSLILIAALIFNMTARLSRA